MAGTPAFMAPEAARGLHAQHKDSKAEQEKTASLGSYDAVKANAWGVGAIIFYAANGRHLLCDDLMEPIASSDSHASSSAAHQTLMLKPGDAANAAAAPRTLDDHARLQRVLKSGSSDPAKSFGSSEAASSDDGWLEELLEVHSRCKVCRRL